MPERDTWPPCNLPPLKPLTGVCTESKVCPMRPEVNPVLVAEIHEVYYSCGCSRGLTEG